MSVVKNFKVTIVDERLVLLKQDEKWFFINHKLGKELEIKNVKLIVELEKVKREFAFWEHNKEELNEYLLVICLNILEKID